MKQAYNPQHLQIYQIKTSLRPILRKNLVVPLWTLYSCFQPGPPIDNILSKNTGALTDDTTGAVIWATQLIALIISKSIYIRYHVKNTQLPQCSRLTYILSISAMAEYTYEAAIQSTTFLVLSVPTQYFRIDLTLRINCQSELTTFTSVRLGCWVGKRFLHRT